MRIDRDINEGNVTAAEIQSLAGLLCWASKVIPYGMIYARELYSVVVDLGMSSATRAQAKKTHVIEAAHIARVQLLSSPKLATGRRKPTRQDGSLLLESEEQCRTWPHMALWTP